MAGDPAANDSLERQLGEDLRRRGWTLALGESCTGGLVAHRITEVPGSSEYFRGGVVAYSNPIKEKLLQVSAATLARHGAVSEETAREMARGARQTLAADVGLSVTGIAGPGGGTPEKPVGLTLIAVSTPHGDWVERHLWTGDRQANKQASAEAALRLLLRVIGERS
jgi:PncC family amidohydrolase